MVKRRLISEDKIDVAFDTALVGTGVTGVASIIAGIPVGIFVSPQLGESIILGGMTPLIIGSQLGSLRMSGKDYDKLKKFLRRAKKKLDKVI